MSQNFFDVIIPVHKKDLAILEYCIEAAKNKLIGVRRIITISRERYTKNAEWFAESNFPFTIQEVAQYVSLGHAGWYFQQLLKMYAPLIIPDVAKNVMILDSDTVFFKKTKMFDDEGRPFYSISKDTKICRKPFDIRVEEHIVKLWPEISRNNLPPEFKEFSGIAHNMMFNRDFMEELFQKVEKYDGSGDKFYKIFLKCANQEHSASEYQIYFNFLTIFHRDKIAIRRLKYKNTADINIRKYRKRFKYHYCSFHSYLRHQRGSCWKVKSAKFLCDLYKKLFQIEQWNIGVANCNISEFLTIPNQDIKWLSKPCLSQFRADQFGLILNNKKYIFFEKYLYCKRKGEIAVLEIDESLKILNEHTILEDKTHFSYPYIFCENNENYAVIENHRAHEVAIYNVSSDLTLQKSKIIFKDLDVVDPSIIKHQGRFYMFFTLVSKGDSELYIAHCDTLFGDWKMHKKNPVKSDISNARAGGEIFLYDSNLYRPAQNCLNSYGASLKINKIIELSAENFSEIEEIEITPNQLGQYPNGLHNISKLGENLTLVDGKRKTFSSIKPLIYLCRAVVRLFSVKKGVRPL
ncbi:MAG TPA: hypothetical protein VI861_04220 [Rickettsiales bacterium]|nr:hypothetical protein [Rickettsiales bacterium]